MWNEALNLAGVEASSTLRRVENVYYPRSLAPSSSASLDDAAPNVASPVKEASSKDPLQFNNTEEVAKQADRADKLKEVSKANYI